MSPPDERSRHASPGGSRGGWLLWWRGKGATTQALLPGLYAWAVTVAPVGWSRGASAYAGTATAFGLVSLASGPIVERRSPDAARMAVGWGLVTASIATWVLASDAAIGSFDAGRGIAGMFGWGLFTLAVASPTRPAGDVTALDARPATSRAAVVDTAILLLGLALAIVLEVPGWRIGQRERALLLRLIALAAGLSIVSVAATIAVTRRSPHDAARRQRRIPAGLVAWPTIAFALLAFGAAYGLWHGRP